MKWILALFALAMFSSVALADCTYNGKSYPTGTVIGGYFCGQDGKWSSAK